MSSSVSTAGYFHDKASLNGENTQLTNTMQEGMLIPPYSTVTDSTVERIFARKLRPSESKVFDAHQGQAANRPSDLNMLVDGPVVARRY